MTRMGQHDSSSAEGAASAVRRGVKRRRSNWEVLLSICRNVFWSLVMRHCSSPLGIVVHTNIAILVVGIGAGFFDVEGVLPNALIFTSSTRASAVFWLLFVQLCALRFLTPQYPRKKAEQKQASSPEPEVPIVVEGTPSEKPDPERQITVEELKTYGGDDPSRPIYVGVRGVVYDMSSSRHFYGRGGPYNVFAGLDASRGLAKVNTDPVHVQDWKLDGLTESELHTLGEWEAKYQMKYPVVGKIVR